MPSWRDAAARYDAEVGTSPELDRATAQYDVITAVPAYMTQPGATHLAVMRAVVAVLSAGLSHPDVGAVPVTLRGAVRLLRRLEPVMLEELSKIPEADVLAMMRQLARGIDAIADSVDPNLPLLSGHDDGHDDTAPPGPDQPPSA